MPYTFLKKLYFVLSCSLLFMFMLVGTAYLFYYKERISRNFPRTYHYIEEFFYSVDPIVMAIKRIYQTGEFASINPQIIISDVQGGFSHFHDFRSDGYFLISAYDVDNQVSSVFLYDISSFDLVKSWVLDVEDLHSRLSDSYILTSEDRRENFRAQHPILTEDGGVIFSSGEGLLVKLRGDSSIEWHIERHFHHSIEYGLLPGEYISQIIVEEDIVLPSGHSFSEMRNDGFVVFNDNGVILYERSIAQILIENGYIGLLLGGNWEEDKIHLNDAQFIHQDDDWVKRGDIMLSVRNLSTVLLYRPSENRIIWLKTGPFLNQHDVDYLGNGDFLIFGNNNIRNIETTRVAYPYSTLYRYSMQTDQVSEYLVLDKAGVAIDSVGRSEVLSRDEIFVEDGLRAMLLDGSGRVLLSYSHEGGGNRIGALHFSRYIETLDGWSGS